MTSEGADDLGKGLGKVLKRLLEGDVGEKAMAYCLMTVVNLFARGAGRSLTKTLMTIQEAEKVADREHHEVNVQITVWPKENELEMRPND